MALFITHVRPGLATGYNYAMPRDANPEVWVWNTVVRQRKATKNLEAELKRADNKIIATDYESDYRREQHQDQREAMRARNKAHGLAARVATQRGRR